MSISSSFTPVPRQSDRHDGWTEGRQRDFIEALGKSGIVRMAAEKVGMGHACAYRLRAAEGAESFAAAWDEAIGIGRQQLADVAMDRALNGVAVPKYYRGEIVGETRWFDNRLLMFMLRQTSTRRFGPHAADFDFADEAMRAQKASEERRLDYLSRAENMIEDLDEMIAAHTDDPSLGELPRHFYGKRERMEELAENLRKVDRNRADMARLDELEASGRFRAHHVARFKKRIAKRDDESY